MTQSVARSDVVACRGATTVCESDVLDVSPKVWPGACCGALPLFSSQARYVRSGHRGAGDAVVTTIVPGRLHAHSGCRQLYLFFGDYSVIAIVDATATEAGDGLCGVESGHSDDVGVGPRVVDAARAWAIVARRRQK